MAELQDMLDHVMAEVKQLHHDDEDTEASLKKTYGLFSYLFEALSDTTTIGFTTLFSRMVFTINKFAISGKLSFELHSFRRMADHQEWGDRSMREIRDWGLWLIVAVIEHVLPGSVSYKVSRPEVLIEPAATGKRYSRVVRGLLMDPVGKDTAEFALVTEEEGHIIRKAVIRNPDFRRQLMIASRNFQLPMPVNLIDCEIDEEGIFFPSALIILPDFLVGVTSVSECFQQGSSFALSYLARKLVPTEGSTPMLIGNIANYFLDELIHEPELRYEEIVKSSFRLAPVYFSTMNDSELSDCLLKVRQHFTNLKKVVNKELTDIGVRKDTAYLEPSFYSTDYGIYGRLDLYHYDEENQQSQIVELKSGKLFRPNAYGLNHNHYIQTLLYDLIIESVYKGRIKPNNYILYSVLDSQRLKFAPKSRAIQQEAMLVRNDIIMIEQILCRLDDERFAYILDAIRPEKIPAGFNFVKRDAQRFYSVFSQLDEPEKQYFRIFAAFLSREYHLSKVGEHGLFKSNGLAALWLDSREEKEEQFTILSGLVIFENNSDANPPIIRLSYSKTTNRVSRFRKGDIAVLYPELPGGRAVLQHQIFKITILSVGGEEIEIQLRSRQKNKEIFNKYDRWNLEPDSLDSGFNMQFHGLFDFISAPARYRSMILGTKGPALPGNTPAYSAGGLTEEQSRILGQIICAKDYYLLWGPPGTGKTSVVIRELCKHYFSASKMNVLFLAYTNRAVDEICDAIGPVVNDSYIRVGSRYSTARAYRHRLLTVLSEGAKNRRSLASLLKETRIYVSTISSFQGKKELLKIKSFDIAIVDEASQLLEPMVAGLMSHFGKFVLIGDHKQLPAVVSQDEKASMVQDPHLRAQYGLTDCRISLFERMYRNCLEKGWDHAIGALTLQGRMHRDIVRYVNEHFYEGKLGCLPFLDRLKGKYNSEPGSKLQQTLCARRMIFIDIPVENHIVSKSSQLEAEVVVKLVDAWKKIYKNSKKDFNGTSLGVISPFRAQIAHIKAMQEDDILGDVTIDTIERYQGGARDHIIISLAVNRIDMLQSITNISTEGIDRKLNVALTRAREHIIILGNRDVLEKNRLYKSLIQHCHLMDVSEIV